MNERKVEKIKAFIKQKPWFEFELISYDSNKLLIGGSTNIHAFYQIHIIFENVFMLQLNFDWQVDTSTEIIKLVVDDTAKEVNLTNRIEQGHQLFEFIPDDISEKARFYISAQTIDYKLL